MTVNADVDVNTYQLKKRNLPEKRIKQQPTEKQNNSKYQIASKEAQFLHLACQGGVTHTCSHVSCATAHNNTFCADQ